MITVARSTPVPGAGTLSTRQWPLPAIAAGLLILAAIGLTVIGRPSLARWAFPSAAVGCALGLYRLGPAHFLEFAWYVWMVTPGIRRIMDYGVGAFDPRNPIVLTPFLVGGVVVAGVLRRLPEFRRMQMLPWIAIVACIVYGFGVGVVTAGPMSAVFGFASWMVPALLGLHTVLHWDHYPAFRAATVRAFMIGSVLLATYGMAQFLVMPEWDRQWMLSSGMYSVGRSFPYEVRVFSLMNSPAPLAMFLFAALFCAISDRGPWRFVVAAITLVTLLLTLVRSAWLAALVGLLASLIAAPWQSSRRLLGGVLLGTVLLTGAWMVVPRYYTEPTTDLVVRRLATFENLSQDVSLEARVSFLGDVMEEVLQTPMGFGVGSTGMSTVLGRRNEGIRDFDNGVFAILYCLGLGAGVLFIFSVGWIVVPAVWRVRASEEDSMVTTARAVVLGATVIFLGGNVFEGASGAVTWGFIGLLVAGRRWTDMCGRSQGTLAGG